MTYSFTRPHPRRGSEFSIGFQHCIDAAKQPRRRFSSTREVAERIRDRRSHLRKPLPHCAPLSRRSMRATKNLARRQCGGARKSPARGAEKVVAAKTARGGERRVVENYRTTT